MLLKVTLNKSEAFCLKNINDNSHRSKLKKEKTSNICKQIINGELALS